MKTAFAYWDGRIAPVFDTAGQIHIVDVHAGQIVSETEEMLPEDMSIQKALRLVELGVGVLVCGAISRSMQEMVVAYNIRVIPFIAGDLRKVIGAWHKGELASDEFAMPGCCNHRGVYNISEEESEMNGRGRRGRGNGGGQGQGNNGQGRGRMGSPFARGAFATCLCPECGQLEAHERGLPCVDRKCSKCGIAMIRQ